MRTAAELRARASRLMAEAASEADPKMASTYRELALSMEQLAKQREMARDGIKAIIGHRRLAALR
jgi:hypothetical protein